jgi:metal-responsive CopG/Arc/MetJ family transcriptional regulator
MISVSDMKIISLNLPEDVLAASDETAIALGLSRAAYIRKAIGEMNRDTAAQLRAKKMAEASRKCRTESMRVNAEFAAIERDPDA